MRGLKSAFGYLTLAIILGCAAVPKPPELIGLNRSMSRADDTERAKAASPDNYKAAQTLFAKAGKAYEDGDIEPAAQHASLGQIFFDTALEDAAAQDAQNRMRLAHQRQADAEKAEQDSSAEHAKYAKRVKRMEKILALQSRLESEEDKSKREKNRLTKQLTQAKVAQEKAKASSEAQLAEQKRITEITNALATIKAKIQTAESVNAKRFAPGQLRSAKYLLAQSERALKDKRFDEAKNHAATADAKASTAIESARKEYAKEKKELDILAERKNLLAAASKLGATDANQQEHGVVVMLHDMFAPGQVQVLPGRTALLDKIADLARKFPDYPLLAQGYTDSYGSEESNLSLSENRAKAVSLYLMKSQKIKSSRIRSAGYGESNPVADNSTAEGRAKNRRVEMVFLFR